MRARARSVRAARQGGSRLPGTPPGKQGRRTGPAGAPPHAGIGASRAAAPGRKGGRASVSWLSRNSASSRAPLHAAPRHADTSVSRFWRKLMERRPGGAAARGGGIRQLRRPGVVLGAGRRTCTRARCGAPLPRGLVAAPFSARMRGSMSFNRLAVRSTAWGRGAARGAVRAQIAARRPETAAPGPRASPSAPRARPRCRGCAGARWSGPAQWRWPSRRLLRRSQRRARRPLRARLGARRPRPSPAVQSAGRGAIWLAGQL